MKKRVILSILVGILFAGTGLASAQETIESAGSTGHGLGVGAVGMLSGPAGIQVAFDSAKFHVEGILGIVDAEGVRNFGLGARGWFHLHKGDRSDFSVGGGIGFASIKPDGANESATGVHLDGGFQARLFLVNNVSLSVDAGMSIAAGDADGFLIGGNFFGGGALTYYFR